MPSSSRHNPEHEYRTRSRSPPGHKSHTQHRSRSPVTAADHASEHRHRHQHERHRSTKYKETATATATASARSQPKARTKVLPFKAQELRKRDLERWRNLFALYLDVQKQLDLFALDDSEVKGRWKSFIRKWNDGDLAEGWYDPETRRKADDQAQDYEQFPQSKAYDHNDDEDDDVGPAMPRQMTSGAKSGPAIPNSRDLTYRDEIMAANRSADQRDIKYERKLERQQQKEQLDELVPRADAGTRERQLEKKQDAAAARAAFRETRSPGAEDVGEGDLMGDDGVDAYRRKKLEDEKKKSERQIRKEEIWRAKAEERREKLREMQAKEDKTMNMLRELAKQRYG